MFARTLSGGIEMRQYTAADASAVFAVVERNREYLRRWLPWVDQSHSAAEVAEFIAGAADQYQAGRGPNCGIWQDDQFIGSIGCHAADLVDGNCCIGYWIEAGHQGKGTITRCSIALLDYLFREMALHRVVIRCAPDNLRSRAIPQRLGFTFEGVLREAQRINGAWSDLEIWSMLAQDWRKKE